MREVNLLELRRHCADGTPLAPKPDKGSELSIRGDALLAVLLDEAFAGKHLRVRSAKITGQINLATHQIFPHIHLDACTFDDFIGLSLADAPGMVLRDCNFAKMVVGGQLRVRGNLDLRGSTFAQGLRLERCRVEGSLNLANARLHSHSGNALALNLMDATIANSVTFENLKSSGQIILADADIGGRLILRDADLASEEGSGIAFIGDRLKVRSSVLAVGLNAKGQVRLSGADIGSQLLLSDSRLVYRPDPDQYGDSLIASGVSVGSDLLASGSHSEGGIRLVGSSIGGQLLIEGATLIASTATGVAVNADRIKVGEGISCQELQAEGEVRFLGSDVSGQVNLLRARLKGLGGHSDTGDALSFDGAHIHDALFLDGAEIVGQVRVPGVQIETVMSLAGAKFRPNTNTKRCINAEGCTVGGSVVAYGMESKGEVLLEGLSVGGGCSFAGARLEASVDAPTRRVALNMSRVKIAGGLDLERIDCYGELRLRGATVGIQLSLLGGRLEAAHEQAESGVSLNADSLEVSGNMICTRLHSVGEVRMLGARIAGQLIFIEARCEGRGPAPEAAALSLDGIHITDDLRAEGLRAIGMVRLLHAKVGGQLHFGHARLEARPNEESAFGGDGLEVKGGAFFTGASVYGRLKLFDCKIDGQCAFIQVTLHSGNEPIALGLGAAELDELILVPEVISGAVDMRHGTVRTLWDAEEDRFVGHPPRILRLEGCRYSFREPLDAKRRLAWMKGAEGEAYLPGVYVELAEAFRRVGQSGDARAVLIDGERQRRKQFSRFEPRGLWQDLLGLSIGYGYRNWLAGVWLVGLVLLGALAFTIGEDSFNPVHKSNIDFSPWLYSIDVTVPILDLDQERLWVPKGVNAWVSLFLSISGYALATAVIAAAAGLLNRDQPLNS